MQFRSGFAFENLPFSRRPERLRSCERIGGQPANPAPPLAGGKPAAFRQAVEHKVFNLEPEVTAEPFRKAGGKVVFTNF